MTRRHSHRWPLLLLAAAAALAACTPTIPAARGEGPSPVSAATPAPSPSASPPPRITLDALSDKPVDVKGIAPSRVVTMVVTGDVIPARNVNIQAIRRGDFLWPWRATADWIGSGDFEFINLEAPLTSNCVAFDRGFKPFCGDPRFIDGLTYSKATIANLSNNHLTAYGQAGNDSTIKLLTEHSIQPCGLGLVARLTVKGVRFAFLGFNGVGVPVDRAEMKRLVAATRPTTDVLIVQFHWGKEYVLVPQSTGDFIAPDNPREIGRLAIDAGADLVIGNHPHAVQGQEIYKDKLITYAHGNFVFDQMWPPDPGQEDPRNGVVGKYVFVDGQLVGAQYRPVRTFDYGQPQFLSGAEAQGVMDRMRLSTQQIAALG